MPQKCKDPSTFVIPCTIGKCTFADAMLDLGVSINIMPTLIYRPLQLGDLRPTKVVIQLANWSIAQPLGVLEDVLVKVKDLVFLANFYIFYMEDKSSSHGSTLILGKPFLTTAQTKIDVHARIFSIKRYCVVKHL